MYGVPDKLSKTAHFMQFFDSVVPSAYNFSEIAASVRRRTAG